MKPSTWLLPLADPRRLASNHAGLMGLRKLEALAIRAGRQLRPRQ